MIHMLTSYQQKASEIIKESIRSAIFIDEQARPFFSEKPDPFAETIENKLSTSLFDGFKKQGVSLAVHQFKKGDEGNSDLKKYLFNRRDLVLLDWKLDGQSGEEIALKFLSEIVKRPHLHFCAIYTSLSNFTEIYNSILHYFSGFSLAYFEELKEVFEPFESELIPILNDFDLGNLEANGKLIGRFIKELGKETLIDLKKKAELDDPIYALKSLKIAFSKSHKSSQNLPVPDVISAANNTLVIQNTIITILKKNEKSDPDKLLERLSLQISDSKNSFTQLLGLEMQTLLKDNSSFINAGLLNISKDAILSHRQTMLEHEKSDIPFKSLIKNVLLEHTAMSLRTSDLSLLESSFLDSESGGLSSPGDKTLYFLNVFYNSSKNSTLNKATSNLNFGDVFVDQSNQYYICITALCDCLRPKKNKNNFFFARGTQMELDLALKLGDSAFISFLPDDKVISWVAPEIRTDKKELSNIEDYQSEVDYLRQFKYKPIYIKPISFFVPNTEIKDNLIELKRRESEETESSLTLKYVTTIRPNYCQRIANHAFAHPIRIGVEFAMK